MAASIPSKLQQAGIAPFIVRSAQLERAKPVIAYWCDYWVVNQILAKQLHNADDECLQFTTTLMDKLEQTKEEQAGNDAVLDDVAGQAYVEQFAQETFDRADRTLKANKVSQQTANTFQAAATFFELINIWQKPDPDTAKKIKFCKFHAARILKAVREGKDPNESNPKPEGEHPEAPSLDPNDPEVLALGQPRPAAVEDAPDEERRAFLDPAAASGGPGFSPAPVSAPTSPHPGSALRPEQVSPIAPTPVEYFPSAPSAPSAPDDGPGLQLPSAPGMSPPSASHDAGVPSPPTVLPSLDPSSPTGPAPSAPTLPDTPRDFYRPTVPSQQSPVASAPIPPLPPPQRQSYQPTPPPANPYYQPPPPQPVVPQHTFSPPTPAAPSQPAQGYSGGPPTNSVYNADDMSIVQAQKHAKWAISALNFEDVPTAVRELKAALQTLGAN